MTVDYMLIAVEHEKATWRGTFHDRAEAIAEARQICEAERARVIIDQQDGGVPFYCDPTPRCWQQPQPPQTRSGGEAVAAEYVVLTHRFHIRGGYRIVGRDAFDSHAAALAAAWRIKEEGRSSVVTTVEQDGKEVCTLDSWRGSPARGPNHDDLREGQLRGHLRQREEPKEEDNLARRVHRSRRGRRRGAADQRCRGRGGAHRSRRRPSAEVFSDLARPSSLASTALIARSTSPTAGSSLATSFRYLLQSLGGTTLATSMTTFS